MTTIETGNFKFLVKNAISYVGEFFVITVFDNGYDCVYKLEKNNSQFILEMVHSELYWTLAKWMSSITYKLIPKN